MDITCSYCASNVFDHDPVFVTEGENREQAGQFCNYACLAEYIEENELTSGACCRIDI